MLHTLKIGNLSMKRCTLKIWNHRHLYGIFRKLEETRAEHFIPFLWTLYKNVWHKFLDICNNILSLFYPLASFTQYNYSHKIHMFIILKLSSWDFIIFLSLSLSCPPYFLPSLPSLFPRSHCVPHILTLQISFHFL